MFFAPREAHAKIRAAVTTVAAKHHLDEFKELPVRLVQSGAEVLFNGDHFEETHFA